MSRSVLLRFLVTLALAAVSLVAVTPTAAHAAPALASRTTVMDGTWRTSLYRASCTDAGVAGLRGCTHFSLVFTNPTPASSIAVGRVLFSPSDPKLPDGLLAKVTKVTQSGGMTVVTAMAATPAEAFTGHVAFDWKPDLSGLSGTLPSGARVVPAAQVPAAVKSSLAPKATSGCPSLVQGSGIFLNLPDLSFPLDVKGWTVNVQGWVYTEPSLHVDFHPLNDPVFLNAELDTKTQLSLYLSVVRAKDAQKLTRPSDAFSFDLRKEFGNLPVTEVAIPVGEVAIPVEIAASLYGGVRGQAMPGVTVSVASSVSAQTAVTITHDLTDPFNPKKFHATATNTWGTLDECADPQQPDLPREFLNNIGPGFTYKLGV